MLRNSLFVLVAVLIAACGTLPPPAYEQPTLTFEAQERAAAFVTSTASALETVVALQPTRADGESVVVPTTIPTEVPTLVPPTATPTEVPATATPLPATEAPTAAAAAVDESLAANDPYALAVENASAAQGAEAVKAFYVDENGTEWSCSTCHNFAEDVAGLGPSLVGVGTRAFSRVPGTGPYTYLYNSIRDPQSYVVPEFANSPQQMPHFKKDSLSEDTVYNIIAYLNTLR